MHEKIIIARGLSIAYGANVVLRKANFEICRGDFVCVVGANGSGKSTLVKTILGLLKPQKGEVEFCGGLTARKIGYLPQDTLVESDFPASVEEVVRSGALGRMAWRPFYSAAEKVRALEAMKTLRISKLAKRKFTELSGGQRQKVLLARALMASNEVLFLDEPSNNLDFKSKADFYRLLKQMNETKNLTIVMITHDVDIHDLIGDMVLALRDGDVWMGETKEYLELIHEHC